LRKELGKTRTTTKRKKRQRQRERKNKRKKPPATIRGMRLRRKIKSLNDAIEALDVTLRLAKGNIQEAFARLTSSEIAFVREELTHCITSRTYYLENYHCIQNEQGELMGMFPLWTHQQMIEDAIQKERDRTGQAKVIVLKPRQSGGTEYANGVMCQSTFFTPQAYTMTVAQSPETAAHVQRKVNIAWDNLPWWLRPERMYHSKGEYLEFQRKDERERQMSPGLGSVFVTTHAERGSGVAIGKTIRFFHGTEVSRWGSGEIYTADIEPSMNAPDTLAIMESASLDDTGFFKFLWEESVEDPEPDWIPVFLPVYRAKKFSLPLKLNQKFVRTEIEQAAYDRVLREENFKIADEFFNWRRRRVLASIKRTGGPHAHYAAYPMTPKEAFQSSGNSVFPRHKLDEQEQRSVREPLEIGEILFQGINAAPKRMLQLVRPPDAEPLALYKRGHAGTNRLWVWEPPDPVEQYYLAADTSMGTGEGDYSAAVVWKAGRGSRPDVEVAEWQGWITPTDWARTIYALGWWYNKCEIAVEYMGEGVTTANHLLNDLLYPNIYRPHFEDRPGNKMAVYFHFTTNMKTKPQIVAQLVEGLLEDTVTIRSQILIDELRKWRVTSIAASGYSSYAGVGANDDVSIAAMIGLFCLRKSMMELRAPANAGDGSSPSPTRGARIGGSVYGIFDQWTRMRGQRRSLQEAEEICRKNPGWMIRPIPVTHANTAYSPIYHARGVENQMYREGMDSKEILPAAIAAWKGARVEGESDAEEINAWAEGGEQGGWEARD
jgi:hypothetical protein